MEKRYVNWDEEQKARALIGENALNAKAVELMEQNQSGWENAILQMTGSEIKLARESMEKEFVRIEAYKNRLIELKDKFKEVLQ